ncbi:uncharacterized protein si:ch211-286o17.1 isoform X2 [Neoarius graeffei]|uniref:uncharacterized protein si:ch211-286o17.1 isoform X2 n=1 Tax=Neoarius graeffei TaxID=443677 RepID=UPI00298C77AD|nr:uncharacterized protein si:ch211-286o17.1 isoform X2 [Neoarius graeffei]
MLKMEVFNWKKTNCRTILALASVMCTVIFRGVTCQENTITHLSLNISKESHDSNASIRANVRGDIPHPQEVPGADNPQRVVEFPTQIDLSPTNESSREAKPEDTHITPPPYHVIIAANYSLSQTSKVVCVDEAPVRDKDAVKLKLKTVSYCEENKAKIQSILEHLCGDSSKIELYQEARTNEMIISGDVKGMTDKFDNDNIKDKVGIIKAEPILVNHSQIVLISVLIAGLLLAALLIAAYILKTCNTEAKGARLAEELFQVDEQNQGNTLLSVAPLPPQEPVEKPTSNGESLDSPPTNGHSATQTPVADSEM